jgi:deoxyribonuclease-4
MRRLGVHTSIAGGIDLSILRAKELGCNTLQIFSHNPRTWKKPEFSEEVVNRFREYRKLYDMNPLYIHTSYLINIASTNKQIRELSLKMLIWELDTADMLGADYLILHPGSSSGDSLKGKRLAIDTLKKLRDMKSWNVKLLLENTAGERGDISATIEDLWELAASCEGLSGGFCIDTCHAFQAGYDIRKDKDIEKFVENIIKVSGSDAIKLIHLNDSKKDFNSKVDRHEHIGMGKIGLTGFKSLLNHSALREIPIILETPKRSERDDLINLRKVKRLISYY